MKLDVKKIQHELSPEMEKKIVSVSKKTLKVYLIYILACLAIFLSIVLIAYFFFIRPTHQAYLKSVEENKKWWQEQRQQAEERMEIFERKYDDFNKERGEFEEGFKETEETIEEGEEKLKSIGN